MGYDVQLLRGEVEIAHRRQAKALEAVKELDRGRDDLKSGGSRGSPHWAFVHADVEVQVLDDLPELLRVFRFEPVIWAETGDIDGVELIGRSRKRGDEFHLWSALAPFVEPGSQMDWYGEDEAVERWAFDGAELVVVPGTLRFG